MTEITGGCHCQAVRYRAQLPDNSVALRCNCSMCATCGFVHLIVPAADFELISGEEFICEYRFNTGIARHLFCSRCGIKAFYVPRSNPDGYSLNLHCVDNYQALNIQIEDFDGQNWEDNAATLRHLSQ
ncbi:MAG: GFA family protein [Oceanococcus sp.]